MAPTLGGTQDTEFSKGFTTGVFCLIFSVFFLERNRVLKRRLFAFPQGPGGFRELREAGRNHFHLLLVPDRVTRMKHPRKI